MKIIVLLLFGVGAVMGGEVIPLFKTQNRTYENVVVKAVEPDGIRIAHDSGAAKVNFNDLTPEQREAYGLTQEKRDEFIQAQNAAARIAPLPAKPRPAAKMEANEQAPRYVTAYQIKTYWYKKLPTPRSMDPDFHAAKKAREEFVADVRAGKYDLSADKTAVEYNKQEALRFGDNERASLCENELSRIAQQEAEIQRQEDAARALAEARRVRIQAQEMSFQMSQLQSDLRRLNSDMNSIRMSTW